MQGAGGDPNEHDKSHPFPALVAAGFGSTNSALICVVITTIITIITDDDDDDDDDPLTVQEPFD
jgi:hypothetical protein